jgi:Flp pilus assembly secretin CpaC
MATRGAVRGGLLFFLLLLTAVPPARGQEAVGYGTEVRLSGLSEAACRDVYELAVHEALVTLNYRKVPRELDERTSGLTQYAVMVRDEDGGAERLLIVGLKSFASLDTRLYVWGSVSAAGQSQANPDVQTVAAAADQAAQNRPEGPRMFAVRDLLHEAYTLSCIDTQSCVQILAMLGYNTNAPTGPVDIGQLPVVFPLPFKDPASLVRHKETADRQPALGEETLSAPENRLMILYHSSQTEEVGRLRDLLVETVDVPDCQVLIEGMVIELTEQDFKELGASWDVTEGRWQITFLSDEKLMPFLMAYNPELTPPAALADQLRSTIRMVIQEGKADVLSSPSVLVLNNRNARIQVVRDTPIISTKITRDVQNVDVRFEPVGIVLNIRPRVSQDNSTVTMQIVAEVSEIPSGEFLEIAGTRVAPSIDRRIVETVARVHNNTPFIIGGLIRNENSRTLDRIPILSRIPILGVLFRRDETSREKREVIIVLTPRIITPEGTHRPLMPTDTAQFDFLNNRLFRNTYRVKAEDVFDLPFLEGNESILMAFDRALALVRRHPGYAERSPYKEFAGRVIPGEDAVVIRMIYEIVKKLGLHERVKLANIIFFEPDPAKPDQFRVAFLQDKLAEQLPDKTPRFHRGPPYPKEVLVFRYSLDPEAGVRAALKAPVAQVEWKQVTSRREVEELVLSANRLRDDYRYHEFAFVVDTDNDLARLQAAIALREVALVNNFEELLVLRDFRVGRRIAVPELDEVGERKFLIDQRVAEFFFKSDYYYPALEAKLEKGFEILQETLAREGM